MHLFLVVVANIQTRALETEVEKGSMLVYVWCRNLATDLSAGNGGEGYEYNSSFSLFSCSLTLTVSVHGTVAWHWLSW